MKILQVHNHYRFRGGEDNMFEHICAILREKSHAVETFERRSDSVEGLAGKLLAVGSSIYSARAKRDFVKLLDRFQPELVHIHNVFPLISPSILEACAAREIPVVMRCPNYRLICPTGLHLRNGKACNLCAGGREYMCALTNCRANLFESTAMGLRGILVRMHGLFQKHVGVFIPPSEAVKQRLIAAGFPASRIMVVPNTVSIPETACDPAAGEYVAFAGRLSEEKGVETLLAAAALLPDIPFVIAGTGALQRTLQPLAPANVQFVGQLHRAGLDAFYARARICVVPSVWHEAFGLVAAEASAMGLPVVASRMGALPEIVDEGETGLLFESGNGDDLARQLKELWASPDRCREMGKAGREKVRREYAHDVYYGRLMGVYERALGRSLSAEGSNTLANAITS